jgi:esterase/lipase superfamily enzyme
MRWLITNRKLNNDNNSLGDDFDSLSFWMLDPTAKPNAPIDVLSSWTRITAEELKQGLVKIASRFPPALGTPPEDQKHLTLFIHGFDTPWVAAVRRYDIIAKQLFDGPTSMGEVVCFDWPSKGSLLGYLPDRAEARQTGDDLTEVLEELYDWMSGKQEAAAENANDACRAKTSIIAHSMGNYALEYAMNALWTRKNRPLLVSLLQEVIMVAADVDNDLFRHGDTVSHGDGEGLSNLSYRITALYTGRDNVLGASAGLKHFGKRRLGRAGLDDTCPVPDNVWDVDCSDLIDPHVNGIEVHGAYFDPARSKAYDLIRGILEGRDRSVLIKQGVVPMAIPRAQLVAS